MDFQSKVEDIWRDTFFGGTAESFRNVICPRTARRCCPGSIRTSRLYFVKVKASRSRAEAGTSKPDRTHRTRSNFIWNPQLLYFVAGARFHKARLPQRPTRSATAPCPAWGSRSENHISCGPVREPLCLRRRARWRSPFCSRANRSFEAHVHLGQQSTNSLPSILPKYG